MGAWATTDKAAVELQTARIRAAFERAFAEVGLTPRALTVTYAPVGPDERTIKVAVDGLGETDGG